jgi:hypothetical protein
MRTASLVPVTVPVTILLPESIALDARYELLSGALHLARTWPSGFPAEWRDKLDTMPWDVPNELRALGFHAWCSGYERAVFLHVSGWCLKAPIGGEGVLANRDELRLLGLLGDTDLRLFAETYGLPDDILLQRQYEVDPERVAAVQAGEDHILSAQVRLNIRDITPFNLGWTRSGAWVFLDWAGGARRPLPVPHDLWADEKALPWTGP